MGSYARIRLPLKPNEPSHCLFRLSIHFLAQFGKGNTVKVGSPNTFPNAKNGPNTMCSVRKIDLCLPRVFSNSQSLLTTAPLLETKICERLLASLSLTWTVNKQTGLGLWMRTYQMYLKEKFIREKRGSGKSVKKWNYTRHSDTCQQS